MTKMITLSMITGQDDDGLGEDDALSPTVHTLPVTIVNPYDRIRSFHPRKHNAPGTRIAFLNGSGLIVKETAEEVAAALNSINN